MDRICERVSSRERRMGSVAEPLEESARRLYSRRSRVFGGKL